MDIDNYLKEYRNNPAYHPIIVRQMVNILKALLDMFFKASFKSLPGYQNNISAAIKYLKKKEPKLFYQARPYLGRKRRKLLKAILIRLRQNRNYDPVARQN